jgi:hypothetical protein
MEAQTTPALSPWLTIWIKPKQTIRRIVDSDPQYQVIFLAVLVGIIQVLNQSYFLFVVSQVQLLALFCFISREP